MESNFEKIFILIIYMPINNCIFRPNGLNNYLSYYPYFIRINHHSIVDNAVVGGWLLATYGIMQLIFAPIMGAVSDRIGRRPVLILCFVAFSLDYLLYAFSEHLYVVFSKGSCWYSFVYRRFIG